MEGSLIKHDRRGRLRYSSDHRQALLAAYDASGMSGPQFAAAHGVKYQTFILWLRKRSEQISSPLMGQELSLVEVERVAGAEGGNGLLITLPGGAVVEVRVASQVPLVATLIRELAGKPC